ncbi:MAG: hypothetical protein ABW221_04085 [Vicinamibacteria bacterium]
MKIERREDGLTIELSGEEARLLRRALERASFIDTPAAEQPAILSFCSQALDALPPV